MKNQNELHTLQPERLRRDLREGLDSGAARPWSADEMKRGPKTPCGSKSRRIGPLASSPQPICDVQP